MTPHAKLEELQKVIQDLASRLQRRRDKNLSPLQKHVDKLQEISADLSILKKRFSKRVTAVSGESYFGPFFASKRRSHFHRPDCKWLIHVLPEKRSEFLTHKDAVKAGCRPCKTCRS